MRKLAWGNMGVSETGPVGHAWTGDMRRPRHLLPALLITSSLAVIGLYGLSLLMAGQSLSLSDALQLRSSDQPWLLSGSVGRLRGWLCSVRFRIDGVLPFGPFGTILKLAVGTVAAAVLLHAPRRT